MPMNESEDPKARLAALADAGRAKREAEAAAQQHAERSEEEAAERAARRHDRLMSFTTWSSLSSWMSLVYWLPFIIILSTYPATMGRMGLRIFYFTAASSAALAFIGLLAVLRARQQDIAYRAALPFPLVGYTAVLGRPARTVRCEIEFAGPCPPPEMFADLLRSLHHPTKLDHVHETGGLRIDAQARTYSMLDEHCRWMPRWFRAFNKTVLQPVHAVYPIRSVTLH